MTKQSSGQTSLTFVGIVVLVLAFLGPKLDLANLLGGLIKPVPTPQPTPVPVLIENPFTRPDASLESAVLPLVTYLAKDVEDARVVAGLFGSMADVLKAPSTAAVTVGDFDALLRTSLEIRLADGTKLGSPEIKAQVDRVLESLVTLEPAAKLDELDASGKTRRQRVVEACTAIAWAACEAMNHEPSKGLPEC